MSTPTPEPAPLDVSTLTDEELCILIIRHSENPPEVTEDLLRASRRLHCEVFTQEGYERWRDITEKIAKCHLGQNPRWEGNNEQ